MNKFEALCKLASDENWCWNLYCTTCGHMHFKYAFREIVKHKSPENPDWIIHNSDTNLHRKLGRLPRDYNEFQKDMVLKICRTANIISISQNCKFPDWLGYLGLVLEHMRTDSRIYKSLSKEWASQLKDIVPEYSRIHSRLSEIVENDDILLNIKDLESCETYIQ